MVYFSKIIFLTIEFKSNEFKKKLCFQNFNVINLNVKSKILGHMFVVLFMSEELSIQKKLQFRIYFDM